MKQIKTAISNGEDHIESAGVRNVIREDENPCERGLKKEKILESAPEKMDDMIKVKKIL